MTAGAQEGTGGKNREAVAAETLDCVAKRASHHRGDEPAGREPVPSAQLLASARVTAFAHYQATGNPITADEIADRLGVPPALAESLLDHIDGTSPSVTEVNGTVMNGSRP